MQIQPIPFTRPVADFNGKPFTFGYDELSRRKTLTYPSGAIATYGYHPETGWLSSLVTKNTIGAELINLDYGVHDKVGNRKTRSENGVATTYNYNAVYQVTQALSGTSAENLDYEAVGNRKSGPTVKETEAAAYDHATDNGMTLGRKFTYTYDDYGNRQYGYLDVAHSKYWQYTWNGENRLTKAELKKNSAIVRTVSFKYDPFGRRIEKKVEVPGSITETRTYVYDSEDIVIEYVAKTGATTKTIRYIHGPGIDQPLAMVNNGQTYYYHADGLGSIVALTNSTQSVMQRYTYDAYGVPKPTNAEFENPYLFTGREWDRETGLYYYRGRYYDPMEGRFISKDPIGFAGEDVNLYRYVRNNSVNGVDPFGLWDSKAASSFLTNSENGWTNTRSQGKCAKAVRQAINAGGVKTPNNPIAAASYQDYLPTLNFQTVDQNSYKPQLGDITVFPAIKGNPSGHIEMYVGNGWQSDYIQPQTRNDGSYGKGFFANQNWASQPFTIFRFGNSK